MAAVPVQIDGVLWDVAQKKGTKVTLIGQASIFGLSVGGGPIIPPDVVPPDPGQPPGAPIHPIWGPPGFNPPGPGMPPGIGGGPIIPPDVPPGLQPPVPPQPGDPTTVVPPPAGSAGWPVQPIAVPPYMIVMYPGVGPVVVAPPAPAAK
jgi:hypothetical protein